MALRDRVADRLMKGDSRLSWNELIQALKDLPSDLQSMLAQAASLSDERQCGRLVVRAAKSARRAKAEKEADAMLADGTINVDELNKVI